MTQSLITSNFLISVDYSRSVPEMIAAGKYGYVNSEITAEHFPITGEGKQDLEIVLVHFNKEMQSIDVLLGLDEQGFRPATLAELLAFGEAHPDVQRQFPVVALGSIWRSPGGNRSVPYLDNWREGRELVLLWFEFRWGGSRRFAAVKK